MEILVVFLYSDSYLVKENTAMQLVVAYMRSGSTLTANLVRHTPGDFYMFEPLFGIEYALQRKKTRIQFLNGTER